MTAERVEAYQLRQKKQHDSSAIDHSFKDGDSVFVKICQPGVKWLPGGIVKKTGPVSFAVRLGDGQQRRCHQDQISVEDTFEPTIETEVLPVSTNNSI